MKTQITKVKFDSIERAETGEKACTLNEGDFTYDKVMNHYKLSLGNGVSLQIDERRVEGLPKRYYICYDGKDKASSKRFFEVLANAGVGLEGGYRTGSMA